MPTNRVVRALGIVLTVLCLLFFARSLLALNPDRVLALPVAGLAVSLVVWSLAYVLLCCGVGLAFAHLVRACGHGHATTAAGIVVWGKANIAKYLPGNVLHFAGRQVLGARHGWPQASIAGASLLEAALQVLLPCAIAVTALVAFGKLAMLEETNGHFVPVVLLALLGLGVVLTGRHLRRFLPQRWLQPLSRLDLRNPGELRPAVLWHLLFFTGMSLIVWWIYSLVAGYIELGHLPILTAAFLISWLMGFIVPGAPGGIGVRESSFAVLGGVFLSYDTIVIVALVMRLVTLLGEGLLYLLALWLGSAAGQKAMAGRPGALLEGHFGLSRRNR